MADADADADAVAAAGAGVDVGADVEVDAALARLLELWAQERATSAARFAAERATRDLAERAALGTALTGLALVDVGPAPGGRLMLWLETTKGVPIVVDDLRLRPGDPVVVHAGDPDGATAVRGVLARRAVPAAGATPTVLRVGVMIDGELPAWLEGGRVHVDADDSAVTFDRGDRAIARLRAASADEPLGRMRDVLFGAIVPEFGPETAAAPFDDALDAAQRAAVNRAMAALDVALVHGPPGTGKTRVLVEIVRQRVARGERVLATAASNAAVDHLGARLDEAGLRVVRLGHPARIAPRIEHLTLDAALAADRDTRRARAWLDKAAALRRRTASGGRRRTRRERNGEARRARYEEARQLERDGHRDLRLAQDRLLDDADVVCVTCSGADTPMLAGRRFDVCVVDEATQAVDPLALVALARAPCAIMAGDPRQLPPTVLDPDAARAGLGVTIFERLAAADAELVRMLVTQHRMHRSIERFPSESMYGGALVAAPEVAGHVLEDLGVAADPRRPGPLVFVDLAGSGADEERADDDPSTHNPGSAARTAAEVRRLLSRGLAPADLAVITPYDAQVRHLRELLPDERLAGLEIGSVDGFQGREKEAVIVDLVRSNDRRELGFLADIRRMNVALTRARRFLLVVGDSATLGGHPYYAAFFEAVARWGAYLSAYADDAASP